MFGKLNFLLKIEIFHDKDFSGFGNENFDCPLRQSVSNA